MKEIKYKHLKFNPFNLIGDECILVTAGNEKSGCYTMRKTWGHLGCFGNFWDPTAMVYLRNSDNIKKIVDEEPYFTLCVLDKSYERPMNELGAYIKGLDNKGIAQAGLSPVYEDNWVYFIEAKLVIMCKKIYVSELLESGFVYKEDVEGNYPERNFHTMYIGKIERVLVKDEEYISDTIPETEVDDDIVEIFPKPNDRLKSIIQAVPITRLVLFQYKRLKGMTKEWKSWAWEMLEKGFQKPGIIQLAGEDVNLNQFEHASLIESILRELELEVTTDEAYQQYVLYIAHQVLDNVISAEEGFKILTQEAIDTNYHDAFMEFYCLDDNADLLRDHYPGCYGDGNMREDNIEEWMRLYFEKIIKFNE
jgi:flavin reductase (DIM6/NTAB) family NADH-FMN oxidoreductase RutF